MKSFRKLALSSFLIGAFALGFASFTPFIAPFLSGLGFENSTISYINSFGALAIIFWAPVLVGISDKIGRKKIIILGMLLEIIAIFLLLKTFHSFVFVAFVIGLQVTAVMVVELVLLSLFEDKLRNKKRGIFTGISQSIFSIGIVLGPLVGAYLVSRYSIDTVFIFGILVCSVLVLLSFFLKDDYKTTTPKISKFSTLKEVRKFWNNKSLRGMGILGFFMNFSSPWRYVFLPLFITQDLNQPLKYVGIVVSISMFVNLFQFAHGWLCDRYGSRPLVILGVFISSFMLITMAFSSSILMLITFAIVHSLGASMWNTSAWCYISEIGEKNNVEGQVAGSFVSIAKMGAFISFILSGIAVSIWGIRPLLIIYGVLIIFSIIPSIKYFYPSKYSFSSPLFEKSKV